jgi:3-dehydroquinate dehydratase II
MKIIIINGPNLNLLGTREKDIYGGESFDSFLKKMKEKFIHAEIDYFQSNVEGEIINKLQDSASLYNGIILNPAGYSHTSVAISDAIAAILVPVIEVHISNIYDREEFRHVSLTAKKCKGLISGFGLESYELAISYFLKNN